jgi:hypothetical protein
MVKAAPSSPPAAYSIEDKGEIAPKLRRADGGALQLLHVRREFASIGSAPAIRAEPKRAGSIAPRPRIA